MTQTYQIHFPAQLRQHLKSLRKKRGLTQAQAGALIGVSQARMAEIEANPGVVSLEQLMQLMSALNVTLSLVEEALPSEEAAEGKAGLTVQGHQPTPNAARSVPEPSVRHSRAGGFNASEIARDMLGNNATLAYVKKMEEERAVMEKLVKNATGIAAGDEVRKALEQNGVLTQLRKMQGETDALEALRKQVIVDPATEQVRKALEGTTALDAARLLEQQNHLAHLRKALGAGTVLEEFRKKTDSLSEFAKVSNYLMRRNKGGW